MLTNSLTGGGGGSTWEDDDGGLTTTDTDDDEEDSSNSFDTSTQTLSTDTFGSTGSVDTEEDVEVTTSGDSSDSSPAGGSGLDSAASRYTGIDTERLADADDDAVIDVTNEASDVITEVNRASDRDPSEITTIPQAMDAVDEIMAGDTDTDVRQELQQVRDEVATLVEQLEQGNTEAAFSGLSTTTKATLAVGAIGAGYVYMGR